MTDNHGYNTPEKGTQNWHRPLNENFEQLDTDVEIRDVEANRGEYTPENGAKFLATDTGAAYLGDGSAWNSLPSSGSQAMVASYVVKKDGDETVGVDGQSGSEAFRGSAAGDVIGDVLDAMPDRGSVYFQPGTYDIASELPVTANGAALVGDQAHLRFQDHEATGGGGENPPKQIDLMVSSESKIPYLYLSGLIIDGNKAQRSGASNTVEAGSVERLMMTDCVIRGGKSESSDWGYGLVSGGETDELFMIDNCLFEEADRHAIHNGGRITNCTFINNATKGEGGVVATGGYDRTIVADCHFVNNGDVAIGMFGDDSLKISNNVFIDNYDPGDDDAQVFVSHAPFGDVDITNNVFKLTEDGGSWSNVNIGLQDDSGSITIRGNRFVGGSPSLLISNFTDHRALKRAVIEDNIVENDAKFLRVEGTKKVVIRDNTFDGTGSEPGAVGVEKVDRAAVTDNVLFNGEVSTGENINTARNQSL